MSGRSGARGGWPGWPAVLLIAGLGATALAALQAHRAVLSERALAERALHDYAGFAAWSYRIHMRDALRSSVEAVLSPINHGDALHLSSSIPPAQSLVHYMPWDEACYCHLPPPLVPSAFVGFTLGSDTLAIAVNRYPQPERGWLIDTMEARLHGPPALAARLEAELPGLPAPQIASPGAINEVLTRHVRRDWPTDWGYGLIIEDVAGTRRILAYRPMARSAGDTIVYAVEYTPEDIVAFLTGVLESETLLPDAFTEPMGRTGGARKLNRWLIDVQVSDERGRPLFASSPDITWEYDALTTFSPSFAGIGVHAQIRPQAADEVLAGGLPRSRLPFLVGLLALAAALSAVALGQLKRDAELSRTRADFVSSVSHELRTPLAQIRLYLETLRLGRARTEADRAWSLDNLERETTRLTHLVDTVLQFGRSTHRDGDPVAPEVPAIDVSAEAARIAADFAPLAGDRAEVRVDADGVAPARIDPDSLRQILLNLLDNAVKYGPRGQVVRVAVRNGGDTVTVSVADEGEGVPASERERIWQPFVRGRNGGARVIGGSGIGLTVVRDLAREHGGDAAYEPGAEGGARFVVRLPAAG